MIIYKITNLINNKIYIGLTRNSLDSRWSYHIRDSKNAKKGIDAAIRKYGKENFKVEIIDETATTLEELNNLEIYYIKLFNSTNNKIGYNQTSGGGGIVNYHHSEETKIKCGSSFRGKHRIKTSDQVDKWRKTYYQNGNNKKDELFCKNQSKNLKLAYAEGRRKPNGKGVGGRGKMSEEEKLQNINRQKDSKRMFNKEQQIKILARPTEFEILLKNGFEFCTRSTLEIYRNFKYVNRKEFKLEKPL